MIRARHHALIGLAAASVIAVTSAAPAQAAPVVTDQATFFVADFGSTPRVSARLTVASTSGSLTYLFAWTSTDCASAGTVTTCTYVVREGDGVPTSGSATFAARAGGAVVDSLGIDYTETRYSITSDDAAPDAEPVFTDLGSSAGSTVVSGSLSPVGRTQVSPFRDSSTGTVLIQTISGASPTIALFGTSFGPESDDGSQLSSTRAV